MALGFGTVKDAVKDQSDFSKIKGTQLSKSVTENFC